MSVFNPFVMKRVVASVVPGLLCCVLFYVGLVGYGLVGGVGFMFGGLVLGWLLCLVLLKNPFSSMLEGKGILVLNVDSTGVIRPFIVGVQSPFIEGKLGNRRVRDSFDRNAVHNMAAPVDLTKKRGFLWWGRRPKSRAVLGGELSEEEKL